MLMQESFEIIIGRLTAQNMRQEMLGDNFSVQSINEGYHATAAPMQYSL